MTIKLFILLTQVLIQIYSNSKIKKPGPESLPDGQAGASPEKKARIGIRATR